MLMACVMAAIPVLSVERRDVLMVGTREVPVVRAADDGLDRWVRARTSIATRLALAACASWDVREVCCPAGCAAKEGPNWPKADEILRACMRGLGCTEDQIRGATVFIACNCPKK